MLLRFFNNTQQQHNDMPQNVDNVDQQYIAINIVNGGGWSEIDIKANSAQLKLELWLSLAITFSDKIN